MLITKLMRITFSYFPTDNWREWNILLLLWSHLQPAFNSIYNVVRLLWNIYFIYLLRAGQFARIINLMEANLADTLSLLNTCSVEPEMPTSGDLKSGDCHFFTPPRNFNKNWPSPQWEWLRTLYDVLHDVHIIKIWMLEIIFVNDKNAPETVLQIRKIQVLS